MPSPCRSVSHNRRDHLAHKTGGPEMGAHIQCTHDATCGGGKTGKKKTMKCEETEGKMEGRWWNDSRQKKTKRQTETGGTVYTGDEKQLWK